MDIKDGRNREYAERIITRMLDQSQPEINHVLKQLFPNSPTMRLKAVSEDFAEKRVHVSEDFLDLLKTTEVNLDVFRQLASADKDPKVIMSRKMQDPTKFVLTLTCLRTPFKEFFDDCREITCESCLESRIPDFQTENSFSKRPWLLKLDRVEQRRIDLCKNCGSMFNQKTKINLQNERLLYTCNYCGHKGWTKAK